MCQEEQLQITFQSTFSIMNLWKGFLLKIKMFVELIDILLSEDVVCYIVYGL